MRLPRKSKALVEGTISESTEAIEVPRSRAGRPKGSKNKVKKPVAVVEVPKRRPGRPKGAKNKVKKPVDAG